MVFAIAQRLDRAAITRMVVAGGAWGLALAAGLAGTDALQCGLPCPGNLALTGALGVATGILTVGPVAAFAGRG
jgi:hypothetical protein